MKDEQRVDWEPMGKSLSGRGHYPRTGGEERGLRGGWHSGDLTLLLSVGAGRRDPLEQHVAWGPIERAFHATPRSIKLISGLHLRFPTWAGVLQRSSPLAGGKAGGERWVQGRREGLGRGKCQKPFQSKNDE